MVDLTSKIPSKKGNYGAPSHKEQGCCEKQSQTSKCHFLHGKCTFSGHCLLPARRRCSWPLFIFLEKWSTSPPKSRLRREITVHLRTRNKDVARNSRKRQSGTSSMASGHFQVSACTTAVKLGTYIVSRGMASTPPRESAVRGEISMRFAQGTRMLQHIEKKRTNLRTRA